jgi:hypothetical protein
MIKTKQMHRTAHDHSSMINAQLNKNPVATSFVEMTRYGVVARDRHDHVH